MKQINHPHLLKLYEVWESMHSFYYVIELANGGSLMDRISVAKRAKKKGAEKEKDGQFTENEIKQYMKQLIQGLHHLKDRKIMHRDIKPDNILLRKVPLTSGLKTPKQQHLSANQPTVPKQYKYEAIMVDFGLGTLQDVKEYLFPKCGTPGYVAPEIINLKGDLAKPLFLGPTTKETIEMNKKCQVNYNIPELKDCDKHAMDLMKKMLEKDPNQRIDPKSALKHPYLKSLDFNFDDDLVVPEDTPTQIESVIKKFSQETFDMSRINSLLGNSYRQQQLKQSQEQSTNLSNASQRSLFMQNTLNNNIQTPNNTALTPTNLQFLSNVSFVSNQNSPANQDYTHSDYDSHSQYSNFKQKESINETELNFVNKNQNVYGGPSKNFMSQSSFDNEKSPTMAASETSIMSRQESLNSNYSLKMKAHQPAPKDKNQGSPIRHRALSVDDQLDPNNQNNLLNPNGNPPEGRTKSPSKFKIDFEKSRASCDQFDQLNQNDNEETSKEAEVAIQNQQQYAQIQQNIKKKARDLAIFKDENKMKFKKGTLDEQFYIDQNL